MANFTIKQLRYFEALAQHQHFGRAAEASSISQPALSVQIKELEQMLGKPLVERASRQVRLTSFGAEFLVRASGILRSVDDLNDFARAAHGALAGRFRLGVIPTIAPYFLPRIIAKLQGTHPDLDLHVRETLTPRLVDELGQGQIDAAIVALPILESSLTERPIFEEKFVLVRPLSQATAPVPKAQELRAMRLLLLEEGHCFRDQTLNFCNTSATAPSNGLDGSSLSTLVQMVGAGIGVTLIPEMAVDVETRSAAVCCAPFEPPQPGRQIGMVWRKSNPLAHEFESIATTIGHAAGQMGQFR